jgi:hypothetical protein
MTLARSQGFGAANARTITNKEAANSKQHDLHCVRICVSLPEVPFWLAERRFASLFLTSPTKFVAS